jgi:type I site-specific restriction-modification system R (restriction) subunit
VQVVTELSRAFALCAAAGVKGHVAEEQIIDVFTAAGLKKPDISILSDQLLAEVRGLKHRNVAAELLEKLLHDEIKVRSKRNLVQSQFFSDKLQQAELLCADWSDSTLTN